MKIALAQTNPTVGDFAGNSAKIIEVAREAKECGADLVVFSELCLCGYLPLDLLERPVFLERNRTELARVAKELPLPAIVGYAGALGSTSHETAVAVAEASNAGRTSRNASTPRSTSTANSAPPKGTP